jgi:hypothetical protein
MSNEYSELRRTFAVQCRRADAERRKAFAEGRTLAVITDNTVTYVTRANSRAGAPASTVEAAMYQLRERGIEALKDPSCQRRLSELSNTQLRDVVGRLKALRARYPKITKEVIAIVAQMRLRREMANAPAA